MLETSSSAGVSPWVCCGDVEPTPRIDDAVIVLGPEPEPENNHRATAAPAVDWHVKRPSFASVLTCSYRATTRRA